MINQMVKYNAATLDSVFGALSDPTRRSILQTLARAETCVTDLAGSFSISLPAVSKHLRVLEKAGLILRRRDGRVHRLRLEPARMREAGDWIGQYRRFWEHNFSALADYLEKHPEKPKKK